MVKFDGYNKDGAAQYKECVSHDYHKLPGKGLGRSMEGVELYEPVVVELRLMSETVTWGYSVAEIERRAHELNADIVRMEIPPKHPHMSPVNQFMFVPKSQLDNK